MKLKLILSDIQKYFSCMVEKCFFPLMLDVSFLMLRLSVLGIMSTALRSLGSFSDFARALVRVEFEIYV